MDLHINHLEIDHLKEMITDQMQYTYLDQYIQPSIDEYKLKILIYILRSTQVSEKEQSKYIISIMLIQIAMDIHEQVPEKNKENNSRDSRTYQQLTVLAGDYFSGLFYLVLSQVEDIDFIRMLASTIKEINELKMRRYYQEVKSSEEYLQIEQRIESLLFSRVAIFFNVSPLQRMIGSLLFTYKLIREKQRSESKESTPFLKQWTTFSNDSTYNSVPKRLNAMIKQKLQTLQQAIHTLPSSTEQNTRPLVDYLIALNHHVMKEG